MILYELSCESSHPFPADDIDVLKAKILNNDILINERDRDSKFIPLIIKMLNKDEN